MRKYLFRSLFFLFVSFIVIKSHGQIQKLGVPLIINYGIEDYKAGTYNSDISQDSQGIIYVANHYGVLSFDGTSWKLICQPVNKTTVRSLAIDNAGKMYVGCQNEFGYMHTSPQGQVSYVSLLDKVPEDMRNFNDVWKIVILNESVIFFSFNALFILKDDTLKIVRPKKRFQFIEMIYQDIYVMEEANGLMRFNDDKDVLEPIDLGVTFKQKLAFLLPHENNNILIGTIDDGIYIYDGKVLKEWDTPLQNLFRKYKISNGVILSNGYYLLGTINNGILMVNLNGELIQSLNESKGLQSNKIDASFIDRHGNLWLGVDNGIDYVEISSPFTYIGKKNNLSGSVLNTYISDSDFFIATTQGLYHNSLKRSSNSIKHHSHLFEQLDELSNSTYTIQEFDNNLIVGNHNGTFEFKNNHFNPIFDQPGGWTYFRWAADTNYIIGGTYFGLVLFQKINQSWKVKNTIKGFTESSRIMVQDDSLNIWIAHGYKGVFKIKLNSTLDSAESVQFYNSKNGFPSDLFISVFRIRNEILFGTEKGIYYYEGSSNKMKLHPEYVLIFDPNKHARFLKEDSKGNIWFIIGDEKNDETGYLEPLLNGGFKKHIKPFHKLKGLHVAGFENINFYKDQVFIGSKKGLIHYDPTIKSNYDQPFGVVLNEIVATSTNTLIYGTVFPHFLKPDDIKQAIEPEKPIGLPFKMNALNFEFSAPLFDSQNEIKYSCYLEGHDDEWSIWSERTIKEYTNLREGNYIFRVKAKSSFGKESEITTFRFFISPPWYRSIASYITYALLAIGLVVMLTIIQGKRFEIEKRKLRLEQIKEIRHHQAEKVKIILENEYNLVSASKEKLESDLAINTLYLAQLNEKLIEVRRKLSGLAEKSSGELKRPIETIITDINNSINNEEQWDQFKFFFNQAHKDFLQRLTEKYPDLTSADINVAALLRMNLNSKKIASMLNISTKGLDAARLRIRKKINLDTSESLTEFMIKF